MNKIKSIINNLLYPYHFLRATIAYDRAVRAAEENLAQNHTRTYVIKGRSGKLILIDRQNFKLMKKKGIISRNAKIMDLELHCLYCTTYPDGHGVIPQTAINIKKASCIDWLIHNYRL